MFDTVAIEQQGAHPGFHIEGGGGGGGGAIFKTWNIFMRAQKTRSYARAWGVVMNLAHFHTPKIIPTYTQGRSNEFES